MASCRRPRIARATARRTAVRRSGRATARLTAAVDGASVAGRLVAWVAGRPVTDSGQATLRRAGRRWDERLEAPGRAGGIPALETEAWRAAVDPYGSGAWDRRLSWAGLRPAGDELV